MNLPPDCRWESDFSVMRLMVKVVPNASKTEVLQQPDGSLKVKVAAAPEKGKANEELLRAVADFFGKKRSEVALVSGASSRKKTVEMA